MSPEQFCYWLQGLIENLPTGKNITKAQLQSVRDHLATVFVKVTPGPGSLYDKWTKEVQKTAKDYDGLYRPTIYCGGTSAQDKHSVAWC